MPKGVLSGQQADEVATFVSQVAGTGSVVLRVLRKMAVSPATMRQIALLAGERGIEGSARTDAWPGTLAERSSVESRISAPAEAGAHGFGAGPGADCSPCLRCSRAPPTPRASKKGRSSAHRDDPQPLSGRGPDPGAAGDQRRQCGRRRLPDRAAGAPDQVPLGRAPGCWPRRSRRRSPTSSACRRPPGGAPGPSTWSGVGTPEATQTDPQGGDFLTDLLSAAQQGRQEGKEGRSAAKKKQAAAAVQDRGRQDGVRLRAARQPDGNGSGLVAGAVPQRAPDDARRDPGPKGRQDRVNADQRHVQHAAARQGRAASLNVDVTRGWAAIDVKAQRQEVHFVDSHLEAFDSAGSNTDQ